MFATDMKASNRSSFISNKQEIIQNHECKQQKAVKLYNTSLQYSKYHRNRLYTTPKMLKTISFRRQFLLSGFEVSFPQIY